MPLDFTTPHALPWDLYRKRVDPTFSTPASPSKAGDGGKTQLAHFTSAILERTAEVMRTYGKDEMELQ